MIPALLRSSMTVKGIDATLLPNNWSDQLFGNKVASIPMTVIDDLNKAGIMRGFAVLDDKRFAAWLNDPKNRAWRTRTGVV